MTCKCLFSYDLAWPALFSLIFLGYKAHVYWSVCLYVCLLVCLYFSTRRVYSDLILGRSRQRSDLLCFEWEENLTSYLFIPVFFSCINFFDLSCPGLFNIDSTYARSQEGGISDLSCPRLHGKIVWRMLRDYGRKVLASIERLMILFIYLFAFF